MQCPRGSTVTESTHLVKTIEKAKEWYPLTKDDHLPIKIEQYTASNYRVMVKIWDKNGNFIYARG